uniref:Uncharacterized protein n=1 Tax=Anguilla anguilla TaxID=7936 RepID=A0A0E9WC17_ANGAN
MIRIVNILSSFRNCSDFYISFHALRCERLSVCLSACPTGSLLPSPGHPPDYWNHLLHKEEETCTERPNALWTLFGLCQCRDVR